MARFQPRPCWRPSRATIASARSLKEPVGPLSLASHTPCFRPRNMRNGSRCRSCFITRSISMFRPFRDNPTSGLSSLISRRAFTLAGGALALSGLVRPTALFAQAQQRLEVVPGGTQALPIAIPNFVAGSPADGEVGVGVAHVITNNLKRSGPFAPIEQAAYIEKIRNIDAAPQIPHSKHINAH